MTGTRRDRGRTIYQAGGVSETEPGRYVVVSEAMGGGSYTVTLAGDPCSCEDYRHGCPRSGDGLCKHIWAVRFFLGMDTITTEVEARGEDGGE